MKGYRPGWLSPFQNDLKRGTPRKTTQAQKERSKAWYEYSVLKIGKHPIQKN